MGPHKTSPAFSFFGSLIAFLLQVLVAPNIAILGVVPNFMLVFVVLNAMLCTKVQSSLTGFILGLIYDFISQGALGVMALIFTIISYITSSLNKEVFFGSWIPQAFFLLAAAFFGELLHAIVLSILGMDNDFLRSLGMVVIPGSIYSAVFGLIVFPIMSHFGSGKKNNPHKLKGRFD